LLLLLLRPLLPLKDGVTALMYACLKGHLDIAAMLVGHGADMEVKSDVS
jgi:ankyrin repeat protein